MKARATCLPRGARTSPADGVAGAGEGCDADDLRGKGCADLGFNAGQLACTAACVLDVRGCALVEVCGNGRDDDGDGDKDCDDVACEADASCSGCDDPVPRPGATCDDGDTTVPLSLDAGGAATASGWIRPAGDVDVYAVAIPEGMTGTLVAETHARSAGASCSQEVDTVIEIAGHDGVVVARDDDGGESTCSRARSAGLPSGLALIAVAASPFEVSGELGYRLSVRLTVEPCGDGVVQEGQERDDGARAPGDGCSSDCRLEPKSEQEPNNEPAAAGGPFRPPFALIASIDPPQADNHDSDWTAVELPAAARLRVESFDLGGDCSRHIVDLTLHSAEGALLAAAAASAGSSSSCGRAETAELPPGRYLVKVASRPSPGGYRLTVTVP